MRNILPVLILLLWLSSCKESIETNLSVKITELEKQNQILRDSINNSLNIGIANTNIFLQYPKSAYLLDETIVGNVTLCGPTKYPDYSVIIKNEKTGKEKPILKGQNLSNFNLIEKIDEENIATTEISPTKNIYTYGLSIKIIFDDKKFKPIESPIFNIDILAMNQKEWNEKISKVK